MKFSFTKKLAKKLNKIHKKQPLLEEKITKQLKVFAENAEHPSLELISKLGSI